MSKPVFGYWYIRGLAEPARMMFEYSGVEYEDKRYCTAEDWYDNKFKLSLDFPNIPYLFDGEVKLTESWAIFRYLGRKQGLFPTTEKDKMACDMLQGVIETLRSSFSDECYALELEPFMAHLQEKHPPKLRQFEAYLTGRQFLLGDKITFIDFPLYETLDHHRLFMPDIFDEFPNLQAFMKRFESQERISAYFRSNRYHKYAVTFPGSCWGVVTPEEFNK